MTGVFKEKGEGGTDPEGKTIRDGGRDESHSLPATTRSQERGQEPILSQSLQKESTLPTWTSDVWSPEYERKHFCCVKPPGWWYSGPAAPGSQQRGAPQQLGNVARDAGGVGSRKAGTPRWMEGRAVFAWSPLPQAGPVRPPNGV